MNETIVAAVAGVIGGTVSSLVAPWAHWGAEKRRIRQQHRAQIVDRWRDIMSWGGRQCESIRASETYGTFRSAASKSMVEYIDNLKDLKSIPTDVATCTMTEENTRLADEVARIAKQWGLE